MMTGYLHPIVLRIGSIEISSFQKWVSSLPVIFRILTGSYDNTLHIWKTDGSHKTTIPGHCGPIKGVRWIEITGSLATFARFG